MNIRSALIVVIASMMSACGLLDFREQQDESVQVAVTSTDQAVGQFLTGRELDAIEGAWAHDENAFEIIISQNNFGIADGFDYVGIVTRADQPKWNPGDVKLLLRKTDLEGVFDGVWMTRYKSERKMTFLVERDNLIQASYVSNDGNTYFVRIRRMSPSFAKAH